MCEYGRYTDTGWEELPTHRAVLRMEFERVNFYRVAQAPGIRNEGKPAAPAPPLGVVSLAIAVCVVAVVGGGIAAALWGLGVATWAALAVGGLVYPTFGALYLAERRGARSAADNLTVLGRRQRRGRTGHGDATR